MVYFEKGEVIMAKRIRTVTFNENDKKLVALIEKYCKTKDLSFIGAVRELCSDALTFKKIAK